MSIGCIKTIEDLRKRTEDLIARNDVVIIAPHGGIDIDGVGSALGFFTIANKLGKEAYIIVNEDNNDIEEGVKTVLNELPDFVNIEDSSEAQTIMEGKKTLLVATDTNKYNLLPFDSFEDFNDILVVDHHEKGDGTIVTDNIYINPLVSSTCEIVFTLMSLMGINLDFRETEPQEYDIPNIATYLLGGIVLDTNDLHNMKNTDITFPTAAELISLGGNIDYCRSLFVDDYNTGVRVGQLVGNSTLKSFSIAYTCNVENPEFVYKKEDLSKACNNLIKSKNVDAAFAFGFINFNTIKISARSKGVVDINSIMAAFGGGGDSIKAGATIEGATISEVRNKLLELITPGVTLVNKGNCLIKK